MSDAEVLTDASAETEGSTETPEQKPTDPAELIASYKKRQAGAEAARQAEKARADAYETELKALRAQTQSAEQQEANDVATLREQLRAAREAADSADARVAAAQLDAKYPNARKELPEVADEVKLAKFEAMLTEVDLPEAPTPLSPNPLPGGTAQAKGVPEETSKDILARLSTMKPPWL